MDTNEARRKPLAPPGDGGRPARLSNEALCLSARQGNLHARDLLWKRCQGDLARLIRWESRRRHLPHQELEDALQETYFAFHRALLRYEAGRGSVHGPASFTTFLHLVAARSFAHYCARRRTYARRFTLRPVEERAWTEPMAPAEEPAARLEAEERLARIRRPLGPQEIRLLDAWLQTGRDREVGRLLQISPNAARLRRARLVKRLREIFRDPDRFS